MTHHNHHRELPTLEDIRKDVGDNTYNLWHRWATARLKISPFKDKSAEAQHSYIYEDIIRRYQLYQKIIRESNMHVAPRFNWLESWGE